MIILRLTKKKQNKSESFFVVFLVFVNMYIHMYVQTSFLKKKKQQIVSYINTKLFWN